MVTDGWPKDLEHVPQALTPAILAEMGHPSLLPSPPFTIGRELSFDPLSYACFTGYQQKNYCCRCRRRYCVVFWIREQI